MFKQLTQCALMAIMEDLIVVEQATLLPTHEDYMEASPTPGTYEDRCADRIDTAQSRLSTVQHLSRRPTKVAYIGSTPIEVVSSAGMPDTQSLLDATRVVTHYRGFRAEVRSWKDTTKARKQWARHKA